MNRRRTRNRYRDNNKIIAGLLAFVGGVFGVHRFYLGDIGGGIFYLFLFFITVKFFPVTMILGIVEAMRLFNMDQEAFDKKYNSGKPTGRAGRWEPRSRSDQDRRVTRTTRRPTSSRSRERTRGTRTSRERGSTSRRRSVPKRNPFKSSAMDKYKDFDLEEAIVDFHKALKISDRDPDIHFYLASAYSLTEQKDKAFKHIALAVQNGLKNKDRIDSFEDLAYIRIQEEYDAFKENGFKRPSSSRTKIPIKDKVQKKEAEKVQEQETVLDDDILLSQLNKLAELRKKGLISEEEFAIEKEKLIDHKK